MVLHSRVAASSAVPHFLAHAPLLCILGLVRLMAADVIIPSRDLTCYHVAVSARRMWIHGKSRAVIHLRETCFNSLRLLIISPHFR